MPGINQLPAGAEGAAALSLTYASISWICSALVIWLTWVHHERLSYVAIVAYWSAVSTTASITQQIHDITFWEDIMIEQFRRTSSFSENPELAIANGSYGLDLALYYIQYYTYNVEAMCVMFWAGELAQTLYGWDAKPNWRRKLRKLNKAGKVISNVLPLITILLLRAPQIQKIFAVFILLADLPLMLSLTIGSSTMVAILIRYVRTRKKFSQWTPPNGTNNTSETGGTASGGVSSQVGSSSHAGSKHTSARKQGIYDRWLMVRFTCAFVVLGVFDVTNTLFQLTATNNNRKDTQTSAPDLSAARANSTLFLFMPGVTPGVFLFIIFGTTEGHRKMIYETFIPKRWQSPPGSRGLRMSFPRWAWRRVAESPPQPAQLFTSRSDDQIKAGDRMKPLPSRPTPNLRSVFSPKAGASMKVDDTIFNLEPSIRMRDLEAAHEAHEKYYEAHPDQSDDSGPTLPIMRNNDRRSRH